MATPEQKAFCVLQFVKHESVVSVQRAFRGQFNSDLPIALDDGISSFRQRGAFVKEKVQDDRVSEESVERVRLSFLRGPKTSNICRHVSNL